MSLALYQKISDLGGLLLKIKIDKRKLKKQDVDLVELIALLSTGKAILFAGAGFSIKTLDVSGAESSMAKELATQICKLGEFSEDDDLRYVTDYYLDNCEKPKLIEFLKEKYSLKSVSSIQDKICSVNWRRFYTTNYDKSIEIACANNGRVVECLDIDFPTEKYYKRDGLCIHLNGSIDSLNEDSLDSSFKLSTSSYISPDSFVSSQWSYYFKKDLERSSAIVFVGYSMYDIEIQKILFESPDLYEKTYFITRENPDPKLEYTLSKFGQVVPIGVEGFSKLIGESREALAGYDVESSLQAITKYEASNVGNKEIRDLDVETMIMYGHIDDEHIDNGVSSEQRIPYLILRDHLAAIKDFIASDRNVVIYGDMGNGKSILLRELMSYLSTSSVECYFVSDVEGDYIGDIDFLAKSSKKSVVYLDGYERYLDLLTHFSRTLPDNVKIVATSRTAEHERLRSQLNSMSFDYNEICIDSLTYEEAEYFVQIINNLGFWGDLAGLSDERKRKHIETKNSSQISLALLSLFNAPQIKDRISLALQGLLDDSEVKDTIFSIALLEIVDVPCTFSLISDAAGNDKIYSSSLLKRQSFKDLFHADNLKIKTKSSLFCLSLVRNHFSPTYVTKQLQKVAKLFNTFSQRDYEQSIIFKSTLRFSFVERMISDENKKGNLRRYYEDLKVSVPWLKNDPHFWLQYGMANITFKEYPKAQKFLDQSYSLAKSRDQYHTDSIDAQQARLHLLVAIGETNPAETYNGFSKAHSLLDRLNNDVYKFRQVEKYKDFYESCYESLSKGNRVNVQRACQKMRRSIENAVATGEINLSQQHSIERAKVNLDFILDSIG